MAKDDAISGLRVIYGSFMASLLAVSAVSVLARTMVMPDVDRGLSKVLLGLAGLLTVTGPVLYWAMRRSVRAELLPKAAAIQAGTEPRQTVFDAYRRLAVPAAGLIEAPGLLGAISYLAGGTPVGLVITAASAVLLLVTMPSGDSVRRFVDSLHE